MNTSEPTTRVRFKGKVTTEIAIGSEHRQVFAPDEVAEIKDPRFRIALLDRGDFESTDAPVRKGGKKRRNAKPAASKATAKSKAAGNEKDAPSADGDNIGADKSVRGPEETGGVN